MQSSVQQFSTSRSEIFFDAKFFDLKKITSPATTIIITDQHVFEAHEKKFRGWNTIVIKPGEEYKIQPTVDALIDTLIEMEADRSFTIVGVGGGVITDLTGYTASVYMRGIRFGFVPTTLLAMTDASIGGKNGVDVGLYKNMVGVTKQPSFILYDTAFLKTLPEQEWTNGFAEIIKHACIKDRAMFADLEKASTTTYKVDRNIRALVQRNASIKLKVVRKDEFEKGERRLLNFGHTLGHALETKYELSHGQAISIGMNFACHVSGSINGFKERDRVVSLLEKYGLPTYAGFNKKDAFRIMRMDKKRERKQMHYILLNRIGAGYVHSMPVQLVEKLLDTF